MKLKNLGIVFELLNDKMPVSRADLSKLTGMSPTTITRFINCLKELNLVREYVPEHKKVGRTANLLTINKSAFYSLGISIDSTCIHVSIIDFGKSVIADRSYKEYRNTAEFSQILQIAYDLFLDLLQKSGIRYDQICGIGISLIGVMSDEDTLDYTPQLHWEKINVRQAVRDLFHQDNVVIINDCDAALLGQSVLHPEYRGKSVACLSIGSGVGSSILYHDKLLAKPGGVPLSEIGHTVVEPDGMLCDCGNHGCLQTFIASGPLIERAGNYERNIRTMEDIHNAWKDGNAWAVHLIHMACVYIKVAINNLACAYNPDIVLIGGENIDLYPDMFQEVMQQPDYLFEPFKNQISVSFFHGIYQSSILGVSKQVQEAYWRSLLKSVV